VLGPGQTRPSMGQVGMGRKVNRWTDPSVERRRVDPVTSDFAAMVKIHDESRRRSPSTIICIIWQSKDELRKRALYMYVIKYVAKTIDGV
jgi:hypothetical protein